MSENDAEQKFRALFSSGANPELDKLSSLCWKYFYACKNHGVDSPEAQTIKKDNASSEAFQQMVLRINVFFEPEFDDLDPDRGNPIADPMPN